MNRRAKSRRITWLLSLGVLLPVVGAVVYSSFHVEVFSCDVCMRFQGREACRTVSAATKEDALRGAIDNACALISSGVTDSMRCSRTPPSSASCRRAGG